jgi:hypothetical protein
MHRRNKIRVETGTKGDADTTVEAKRMNHLHTVEAKRMNHPPKLRSRPHMFTNHNLFLEFVVVEMST